MQDNDNLNLFRETLQPIAIQKLLPSSIKSTRKRVKGRKNEIKAVVVEPEDDKTIAELVDFVEYLADEIFHSLPDELKTLSYAVIQNDRNTAEKYSLPLSSTHLTGIERLLSPSVLDSLLTYSIISDNTEIERFLDRLLSAYITSAVAVPPEYAPLDGQARPDGCEICDRVMPLTYHHLIPRATHDRVLKRGWHGDWELNKVAWLCRACHSYVHKIATNEELARSYYSTELLLSREDVQRWAAWASRIRWKAK